MPKSGSSSSSSRGLNFARSEGDCDPNALPDATDVVCNRLVDLAGGEAGSIASAWSAQMPDVAALAIRLHAYGTQEARQRALDLLDRLSAVSAYGLDQAIEPFDR